MLTREALRRQSGMSARLGIGVAPGVMETTPDTPEPQITWIRYRSEGYELFKEPRLEDIFTEDQDVHWVHVSGTGNLEKMRAIAALFELHPLVIEDIVHGHQRASVEAHGEATFVRLPIMSNGDALLGSMQLSLYVVGRVVLSVIPSREDVFEGVRERIAHGKGRIRRMGADYLAYALIDVAIDRYAPALEQFGDVLESLEADVFADDVHCPLEAIYVARHRLLGLQRNLQGVRTVVGELLRSDESFVSEDVRAFVRDAHDHAEQSLEEVEANRQLAGDLLNFQMAQTAQKTNEVMRVLTIVASLFIPLTFVAGIYGMNFDSSVSPWNMPELRWSWGYPAALGMMLLVAAGMLLYFRRLGWLFTTAERTPTELS